MAKTNKVLEDKLLNTHPHTFNSLTHLISAMADVYKNRGKKSLLGVDKGLKAYNKFESKLRDHLLAMTLDGLIQRNADCDRYRRAVIDTMGLAMDIWPNWQDSYEYASEFFLDNADQANDLISSLLKPTS